MPQVLLVVAMIPSGMVSPISDELHWHNTSPLHGYLDDLPPAEFEATFYATKRTDQHLVEIQWPEPPSEPEPGRFRQVKPRPQRQMI
jgi:hypothetical protein